MTDPVKPPSSGPGRATWTGVAIATGLVILWVAFLALFGPSVGVIGGPTSPDLAPPSRLGPPVDDPWTLHDLAGAPVDFASFRGRPILLNLWATWCPPCVAEMPSLAALAANPKMKGVAILCVSVDGSIEAPRRYVQGKGWTMTMLHATDVPGPFLTDGIPATFLLDPSGRVVASEIGGAKWDDPSVVAFFAKWADPGK